MFVAHEQLIRFHGHFIFPLSMVQRDDLWDVGNFNKGFPQTKGKSLRMSLSSESVSQWRLGKPKTLDMWWSNILTYWSMLVISGRGGIFYRTRFDPTMVSFSFERCWFFKLNPSTFDFDTRDHWAIRKSPRSSSCSHLQCDHLLRARE